MTDLSFSRRLATGALLLTMLFGISSPSHAQADRKSGQEFVLAKTLPEGSAAINAKPATPPPSGSSSWAGFYVGVNAGYGTADADTFVNPLPTATQFVNLRPQTISPDPTGALGGAQLGYNWQTGHFVFGAEGDIDAAGIDGTKVVAPITQNNGTPFPGAGNNILVHQRTDAISTARGRVGYLLGNRFLIFGTGGLVLAHVGYTANTDFRPVGTEQYPAQASRIKPAVIYGGGAEFSIGGRWTAKGEYLLYDAGTHFIVANPALPLPPFQVSYTWNTQANFFRFGVNYRF